MRILWLLAGLCAAIVPAHAALTLEEALATASQMHPDLQVAEAEVARAKAEQTQAGARSDWLVQLNGALRYGDPTVSPAQRSDNELRLLARKSLYDFGRTGYAEQAAAAQVDARMAGLLDTQAQRRLEIMALFFEVLLADQQYAAENEYSAVAYVTFDHARTRQSLGQKAPAEVAALEKKYLDWRQRRNTSQIRQRSLRAKLASAMNQPGQLASELADPHLAGNDRILPELESLQTRLQTGNPRLQAALAELEASRKRLESLRAEKLPSLDFEAEASDYGRIALTRDRYKAGVILNWPLYQGGRVDALIAREQAQFRLLQARTEKMQREMDQALLETWLEINDLQQTGRPAARQNAEYRDLALERARAEYEVEYKTDLGEAMAATMEAHLQTRRVEYRLALAFARLESLLGAPLSAGPATAEKE